MFKFLSGILIGTCMILPGVSGSVIAIMLGIYEKVIYLINSKEKNIIKIKKLFPLLIGILIGIFIFGKILLLFYEKYTYQMMYVFIGLIIGGIPTLIKEITSKSEKINKKCLIFSFLISIILFLMPKLLSIKVDNNLNFINLFLGGFLYIAGKIVPGISSSFFLMLLGLYEYFLNLITNPFSITASFIPFLLGIIIGLYVFIKLINILLNKYYSKTYSSIIGFILGSVLAIYPGFELTKRGILSFILMLISFELVSKLSKK